MFREFSKKRTKVTTLNIETIKNYTHFLELPLKCVACWDWYKNPKREREVMINNLYLALVLFSLTSLPVSLLVHLQTEWVDVMDSLDEIADGLPLLAAVAIVTYFALHKRHLYDLVDFMNTRFRCHSARGLTNMTMLRSYRSAKTFAYLYTACTLFSVAMYVISPVIAHLWIKQPLQPWIYMDATTTASIVCAFLKQCIYAGRYDAGTCAALVECARVCQAAGEYRARFEAFVSPLLALRVVQVTLYLCTLLYAATEKFDMVTVEYLAAVALDIFVYCYFGNQVIIQAERVSTAAYQSSWHAMGARPRRLLVNLLLASHRPATIRAGNFLPMDLHTFLVIIKTSFSYYTLLVNVNEK
nr:odorant receptor 57 [Papilio glaucus]